MAERAQLVLCADLVDECAGGCGKKIQEGGIHVQMWRSDFVIAQKLTQHCKAIVSVKTSLLVVVQLLRI